MNRSNDPNNPHPKSSRSQKWLIAVKPFWERHKTRSYKGSGTVFLSKDANAVIERMELLMTIQKAGNTCVINELVVILDELKRLKLIALDEYKKASLTV